MAAKYDPIVRFDNAACKANLEAGRQRWLKRLAQFREIGVKPRLLDMDDLAMLERGEMPDFEPVDDDGPEPDAEARARAARSFAPPRRTIDAVIDSPSSKRPNSPITAGTARAAGYSGDACSCGSFATVRNGTCLRCDDCGQTTGCS